jgi:heme/copper-type cytochrome/quinol oxidase subunit 2
MSFFRKYSQEEEHRIALEVINSRPRAKTEYELRKGNFFLVKIIATAIVGIIVAFFIFVLPKHQKNEGSSDSTQPTQEHAKDR